MTETVATPAPEPAVDELARHASKMAKKKAARDKIMAGKEGEKRGLIIVHTGAGKGKSSSGFRDDPALRGAWDALRGRAVHQGARDTGRRRLLTENFSDLCQFHAMGEGFTRETQDKTRDIAAARVPGWEKAKELIRDPSIHGPAG